MRSILCMLLLGVLGGLGYAQTPAVEEDLGLVQSIALVADPEEATALIVGPEEVGPGQLVTLDAATSVAGDSSKSFSWEIPEELQASIDSNGKRCFIAAPLTNGQWFIVLAVAKDDVAATDTYVLTVGDAPDPGPKPPGPKPPVLEGLAKAVYEWAMELVPETGREAEALALADSYQVNAAKIAAGALKTPKEILESTLSSNRSALSAEQREEWLPFFGKLRDGMNAEQARGGMADPTKIRNLWLQIEQGLRSVK